MLNLKVFAVALFLLGSSSFIPKASAEGGNSSGGGDSFIIGEVLPVYNELKFFIRAHSAENVFDTKDLVKLRAFIHTVPHIYNVTMVDGKAVVPFQIAENIGIEMLPLPIDSIGIDPLKWSNQSKHSILLKIFCTLALEKSTKECDEKVLLFQNVMKTSSEMVTLSYPELSELPKLETYVQLKALVHFRLEEIRSFMDEFSLISGEHPLKSAHSKMRKILEKKSEMYIMDSDSQPEKFNRSAIFSIYSTYNGLLIMMLNADKLNLLDTSQQFCLFYHELLVLAGLETTGYYPFTLELLEALSNQSFELIPKFNDWTYDPD